MAIQSRRGLEADFQPNKMTDGETATLLDTKKVYHTFAPGDCRRLATHEEMTEMIDESIEGIKQDFTADLTQAITDSETATATAIVSAQNADDKALLADEAGDRANTAAENAEAVVLGDIATDTTVGVVRGNGDVSVGIDGAMSVNEASNANVTVVEAVEDGELTTGLLSVILGLIKKKFALMLTALAGKIDKTSIAQSAEISDATKVPSTVVTAWLASQISSLVASLTATNNNLASKVNKIPAISSTLDANNFADTFCFGYDIINAPDGNGYVFISIAYGLSDFASSPDGVQVAINIVDFATKPKYRLKQGNVFTTWSLFA